LTERERKLIYIADDYDHVAHLMSLLVEARTAYEAVSSTDGAQMLAQASLRRPDACLLDFDMPHIGGLDAARALKAMFPRQRPVLIAATTGHFQEAVASKAFDHVLRKPVDFDSLRNVLVDCLPAETVGVGGRSQADR
jgi:CheY-like chemotaxis protein